MGPAAVTSPPAELRARRVIGLSHQILLSFHFPHQGSDVGSEAYRPNLAGVL